MSRQKTEDSKQLKMMVDKYSKQSAKLDRMTISFNKLKKQHKQHENVLARERGQYEEELRGLREQLRMEKSLRRNMEQQQQQKKQKLTAAASQSTNSGPSVSSATSSSSLSSSSSSSSLSPALSSSSASSASSSSSSIVPSHSTSTAITRRHPRRAVALYTDFDCVFHATPNSHPESSQRVVVLWERLFNAFDSRLDWCSNSPRVAVNILMHVHSPAYIARFLNACKFLSNNNVPKNFMLCCHGASHKGKADKSTARTASSASAAATASANDHDTFFSSNAGGGSVSAGLRAPGSVVAAVDAVLSGVQSHAFCLIRPPGHHCGYNGVPRRGLGENSDVGQGFCLLNNVAIGMCHAITQYNVRVAIIDIDLHHGNVSFFLKQKVFNKKGEHHKLIQQ